MRSVEAIESTELTTVAGFAPTDVAESTIRAWILGSAAIGTARLKIRRQPESPNGGAR